MSNLNLNTISSLDTGREVDVNRVMQTVDYVGGLVIDSRDTVIVDGDDRYVLAASTELPYTATGAGMPEGGAFVSVGDAKLRGELVQPVATFNSVANMVNATGLTIGRKAKTLGYYAPGDGGGNDYEIVAAGTGSNYGFLFEQLTGSGLEAKLLGGGIMEDKTVYIPSDYASIREAILSTQHIASSANARIVIYLESGFSVTSGCRLEGGDFSRYVIRSADLVVFATATFPANDDERKLFWGEYAKMPTLDCLFDLQGLYGEDGIRLMNGSAMRVEPGAGVRNAHWHSAVVNNSFLSAIGADLSGARRRTLWATSGAIVDAQNSNLSNGNKDDTQASAVTSRRASVVNIQGADITNSRGYALFSYRSSLLNAEDSDISGSDRAALCSELAQLNAASITCNGASLSGFLAESGGSISVPYATITNTPDPLRCRTGGRLNAQGVYVTSCSGLYALSANDNSTCNALSAVIENNSSAGVFSDDASVVNLKAATVRNNTGGPDLQVEDGGIIRAHGTITTNGNPSLSDTNVNAVNSVEGELGIIWAQGSGGTYSGLYTPTITTGLNAAAASAGEWIYSRTGNVVTVSGSISITASTSGQDTQARASIPVYEASISGADWASGVAVSSGGFQTHSGVVTGRSGVAEVIVSVESVSTFQRSYRIQFSYKIQP